MKNNLFETPEYDLTDIQGGGCGKEEEEGKGGEVIIVNGHVTLLGWGVFLKTTCTGSLTW